MALNGTYDGLKASVADFLNRQDLSATIPDFITLAESQLNKAIRCQTMISRTTVSIASNTAACPTDFLAPRSLRLTGNTPPLTLSWVSPEQMDELLDNDDYSAGQPKHYSVQGGNLLFSPTPGGTYTASLSYYAALPALASNGANWLLTAHPGAYLYGALCQSAPYLRDDARLATWAQMFQAEIEAINQSDQGLGGALETQSSNYRSGGVF